MVTQCVCYRLKFEQLLAMARQTGAGLVELHQATGCGGRCGLCIPYIRYMLIHEQAEIPVMWTEDFRALGIRCTTIDRLERRLREENNGELPDTGDRPLHGVSPANGSPAAHSAARRPSAE